MYGTVKEWRNDEPHIFIWDLLFLDMSQDDPGFWEDPGISIETEPITIQCPLLKWAEFTELENVHRQICSSFVSLERGRFTTILKVTVLSVRCPRCISPNHLFLTHSQLP